METEEKNVNATVCSITARKFSNWVKDMGGDVRVAKLLKVDRMSIWRYANEHQAIPEIWVRFINQSEEMAKLKQELAKLKRSKK